MEPKSSSLAPKPNKRRPIQTVFILIVVLLGADALCAQVTGEQPLQEVFRTELVYTQETGELQLTAGFSPTWNQGIQLQWPLQAEYGLTNSWQVQIESDGWQRRTEFEQPAFGGLGDLNLGTKYSFMNIHRSYFHAAIAFEVGIPSGSVNKGLGDGFLRYEPTVMLARDFHGHGNLQLFTQIGVSFVQRMRNHADSFDDALSAHEFEWSGGFFQPLRHVVITSELSWETNRWNHGGRDTELYLTPGAVVKLPGNWELGVGVSTGLTTTSDAVGLKLKFTREFQTRKPAEIHEAEKK